MAAEIVLAQSGQISEAREVGPGARITVTGSGWLEWAPNTLADVRNGVVTWQPWPRGQSAGFGDVMRRMVVRARATGAVQVDIDETRKDAGAEGAFWQEQSPAWSLDANGNVAGLVGPDGFMRPQYSEYSAPRLFAMADARPDVLWSAAPGVTLPNPYPDQANVPVHLSVLFSAAGFGGRRYWMAYTPYPAANSAFENPTVAASFDGEAWHMPRSGVLVGKPQGTAFNADTHLFFNADETVMYLAFRERGVAAQNHLKIMETTDGVSWTEPVTVLSGAVNTLDYGSPSIWWNGTGWTMISHNIDAASPWPIQRRVSATASVYGAWGAPETVNYPAQPGMAWWHSFAKRLPSGQVIGLFQDNFGAPGATGLLYFAESGDDGRTFVNTQLVNRSGAMYRSTFCERRTETGMPILEVWAGTISGEVWKNVLRPGAIRERELFLQDLNRTLLNASATPGHVVWADTFDRADSATTPGTSTSGGTYTIAAGTWGILTNRLYPVASGRLHAAAGTPNHRVTVRFTDMTPAMGQWLMCRVVDGNNRYRVGVSSPTASGVQTLAMQNIVAGVITGGTIVIGRFFRGDYVTCECVGVILRVYVNGILTSETAMTHHFAGAIVGVQGDAGASTFFDDFVVSQVL
jgi:hypothetical protein